MITIADIQRVVAEEWRLPLMEMRSDRRSARVARPRMVAMFLARHHTLCSLPQIGREFGDRDHTTVMHALARVPELMAADAEFAARVEAARRAVAA
jgi:chromosomal replication initiator protein